MSKGRANHDAAQNSDSPRSVIRRRTNSDFVAAAILLLTAFIWSVMLWSYAWVVADLCCVMAGVMAVRVVRDRGSSGVLRVAALVIVGLAILLFVVVTNW